VDDVRRRKEYQALVGDGDNRLARTRYILLSGRENVSRKYWAPFYTLRNSDLKTARDWAVKESLRRLWRDKRASAAQWYWESWYFWATHCRPDPG
jgi:transposase